MECDILGFLFIFRLESLNVLFMHAEWLFMATFNPTEIGPT